METIRKLEIDINKRHQIFLHEDRGKYDAHRAYLSDRGKQCITYILSMSKCIMERGLGEINERQNLISSTNIRSWGEPTS